MKNPKKPTRKEMVIIASYRLNPMNWLVSKRHNGMYMIVHRMTGNVRQIPMEMARHEL
ncbi:DUF6906 family protein [Domibacillus aminovorans]|uniref:DUF6906 family protein n=1 Tax=Domibacillus aminovorans TaxID=29332 RepID=UPI0014721A55|nr:hypothetical protein [Domibacillus aminovorans]